mmetsp:Transcript_91529/g.137050  ORF Transcript_91529/g.137050 Transcript_91529/m.137050 type:complete len:92 (+) Transcript_91529:3-278(+)
MVAGLGTGMVDGTIATCTTNMARSALGVTWEKSILGQPHLSTRLTTSCLAISCGELWRSAVEGLLRVEVNGSSHCWLEDHLVGLESRSSRR